MENENFNPGFDPTNDQKMPEISKSQSETVSQPVNNISSTNNVDSKNISEIEKLKATIAGSQTTANPTMPVTSVDNKFKPLIDIIKNPKIWIGLVIVIILVVVGWLVYNNLLTNKAILSVDYSIKPDKLVINEQEYDLSQENISLTVKPGQYKIVATKENYFPFSTVVNLDKQQSLPVTIDLVAYPEAKEIVEYDTAFPNLNPNQNEITYLSAHGVAFYKLKITDWTKTIISENIFNNITDVKWAPSVRNACLITSVNSPEVKENQKKGNVLYDSTRSLNVTVYHLYDFSKYDLTSQSHVIYPEEVQHPTWHPTKEEILFHYIDPKTGENSISKAKPNLENRELVIELQSQKSVLAQYSSDLEMIAYVDTKPLENEPNNIFIYKTVPRKLDKIPTKEVYVDFSWSPDSKKLLGFKNDGAISLIDVATFAISDLPFKTTKDRIVWLNLSDTLLAAISSGQEHDTLIWYDVETGEPKDVAWKDADKFETINNLFVSADDATLYFVANDNQHLYSLPLVTK